jgi:UDP-N-acetylmuramate-alanine ligase
MLLQLIKNEVTPGDIVLTIGAGDITLLGPQILRYIKNE